MPDLPKYTANQVPGTTMYLIDTEFQDQPVTFRVVVAKDASELDDLVAHHLAWMANPNMLMAQPTGAADNPPSTAASLNDLEAKLAELSAQIADIRSKMGG